MIDNQPVTDKNVYQRNGNVYIGTRQLTVKTQRGKQYVNYNGKQLNIKAIPKVESKEDKEFGYIFNYGFKLDK